MIRVVYRWRVKAENFDAFRKTWSATTQGIHETVPGARGSFMLQACEDTAEVLTVARWDSLESWKAFWGSSNPREMKNMRMLGERVSVEAYEEIGDCTC